MIGDLSMSDLYSYENLERVLDALAQAIVDICEIDTVHAIQDRKRGIMKR